MELVFTPPLQTLSGSRLPPFSMWHLLPSSLRETFLRTACERVLEFFLVFYAIRQKNKVTMCVSFILFLKFVPSPAFQE